VLCIQQQTRIYFPNIGSMALFRLFFCSTASKEQDDEHSKLKFKYDILCCKIKKMESEIVSLQYELERCKEQRRKEIEYGGKSGESVGPKRGCLYDPERMV